MVYTLTKIFKRKPKVYDANELYDVSIKPKIYVQPDGKLCFQSSSFYGELVGMCEWREYHKIFMGVDSSDVVIDCMVKVIQTPE